VRAQNAKNTTERNEISRASYNECGRAAAAVWPIAIEFARVRVTIGKRQSATVATGLVNIIANT
jgi:hypothetical protein